MSRTYRRTAYTDSCSEAGHANRSLERYRRYKMYMDRGHRYYKAILRGATEAEYLDDSIREYRTYSRDGSVNETSQNRGFKESAKNVIRTGNKILVHRILSGKDHESTPYPDRKMGKSYIWDWW